MHNFLFLTNTSAGVFVNPALVWGLILVVGLLALGSWMFFKAGRAMLYIMGFLALGFLALIVSTVFGRVEVWLVIAFLLYISIAWSWPRGICWGSWQGWLITIAVLIAIFALGHVAIYFGWL